MPPTVPLLQLVPESQGRLLRNLDQVEINSVGGTLVVNGVISFTATILNSDPLDDTEYITSTQIQPLRRVRVEAWDEKLSQPNNYNFLSVRTLTSATGFYTLSLSNVDPDGDGTGLDLRLRVYATDDERGEVRNGDLNSVTPYSFQEFVGDNLSDGTRSHILTVATPIALAPFFIHDLVANTGYDYLRNNTTFTNTQKAILRWPNTVCVPLTNSPNSCYYFGTIHLINDDGWDKDVILHEYSHFALSRPEYYGDNPVVFACASVNFDHNFGQHTNPSCAWSEGWANFIQAAIQSDGNYLNTNYPSASGASYTSLEDPPLAPTTTTKPNNADDEGGRSWRPMGYL